MAKNFSVLIKKKIKNFNKKIFIDGDKSITHRALFIASQCTGVSNFNGLVSDDISATVIGLKKLGIRIIKKKNKYKVFGNGIGGLKKYTGKINCGNSGTSARFFLGLLSTYPYPITIIGDKSLQKRPMRRITNYLENIGAKIFFKNNKNNTLPVRIHGTNFPLAQKHNLIVPSAQIKTAILLSALNTGGIVEVVEKYDTRDHTERLLKALGAEIKIKKGKKNTISLRGQNEINNFNFSVPSDPSSACFFVILTLLSKNSSLLIKNVCINKNRIGFIEILKKMNAKIKILNRRKSFNEEIADLFIKSSKLKSIKCSKKIIPRVIDELPVIFVAAAFTKGQSSFKGIAELRYKESDRIKIMQKGLKSFGIKTSSTKDSIKIFGTDKIKNLDKVVINSNYDHRIAMSFYVMAELIGGNILIKNFNTVNSSFPSFLKIQKKLGSKYEVK